MYTIRSQKQKEIVKNIHLFEKESKCVNFSVCSNLYHVAAQSGYRFFLGIVQSLIDDLKDQEFKINL